MTYGTDAQADAGCEHVQDALSGHCGRCGRFLAQGGDQIADTDGAALLEARIAELVAECRALRRDVRTWEVRALAAEAVLGPAPAAVPPVFRAIRR